MHSSPTADNTSYAGQTATEKNNERRQPLMPVDVARVNSAAQRNQGTRRDNYRSNHHQHLPPLHLTIHLTNHEASAAPRTRTQGVANPRQNVYRAHLRGIPSPLARYGGRVVSACRH